MNYLKNLVGNLAGYSRWVKHGNAAALSEQYLFGHKEVLLRALDLPENEFFLGRLQHGWGIDLTSFRDIWMTSFYKNRPIPNMFWNEFDAQILKDMGAKKPLVVGSPWAYLIENQSKFPETTEVSDLNEGVLFFPIHSFHGHSVNLKSNKMYQDIQEVFSKEKITTSLYWLDFINPKIKNYYGDLSDSVICMGYRGAPWNLGYSSTEGGRPDFLIELFKTIKSHRYVVVDHIGTALWYSLSLKKDVLLTREVKARSNYLRIALGGSTTSNKELKSRNTFLQKMLEIEGEVISGAENAFYAYNELGFATVQNGDGEKILRELNSYVQTKRFRAQK